MCSKVALNTIIPIFPNDWGQYNFGLNIMTCCCCIYKDHYFSIFMDEWACVYMYDTKSLCGSGKTSSHHCHEISSTQGPNDRIIPLNHNILRHSGKDPSFSLHCGIYYLLINNFAQGHSYACRHFWLLHCQRMLWEVNVLNGIFYFVDPSAYFMVSAIEIDDIYNYVTWRIHICMFIQNFSKNQNITTVN